MTQKERIRRIARLKMLQAKRRAAGVRAPASPVAPPKPKTQGNTPWGIWGALLIPTAVVVVYAIARKKRGR